MGPFEGEYGKLELQNALTDQELVQHDDDIAKRLTESAEVRKIGRGEQLFAATDEKSEPSMIFVISGRMTLVFEENVVGVVKERQSIGEFPVLDHRFLTHQVTAKADIDTVVAKVSRNQFIAIADECPKLWKALAKLLANRLYDRTLWKPVNAGPAIPAETALRKVLISLHGIRTRADWQRPLSELVRGKGWEFPYEKWYFGYFSVIIFLLPWARERKLRWFRDQYEVLMTDKSFGLGNANLPSVVAHSFGTYLLGHALFKYANIRFNKVILVGSILPERFPWDQIIGRGQVGEVRNEFGVKDIWVKWVRWWVAGSGASGRKGFAVYHPKVEQQRFVYDHSEYFESGHMRNCWLPFLERPQTTPEGKQFDIEIPHTRKPWLLYSTFFALVALLGSFLVSGHTDGVGFIHTWGGLSSYLSPSDGSNGAWSKLCKKGNVQRPIDTKAVVGACRSQANSEGESTYALGCQSPDGGLIMFSRPFDANGKIPQVSTSDWTANSANAGRFADEFLSCAKIWGTAR